MKSPGFLQRFKLSYTPVAEGIDEKSNFLPLDASEDAIDTLPDHFQCVRAYERRLWQWKLAAFISGGVVTILAILAFFFLQSSLATLSRYSPADVAIEYEMVAFHNNFWEDRTPYQGPPTDEVDREWNKLYKNVGIIKIDEKSAKKLPNKTLPIPGEEDSYVVGIEVFHQLHCLDSIRRALYPDRYQETVGLSEKALKAYWIHVEHCIDNIRQVIQCYGDTSTIPWIINPRHHRPAPDAHTTHVCRSFDKLHSWASERAFTQEEYDIRLASYPPDQLPEAYHEDTKH
ncbi:MAG: hypothetical protein Q9227_002112 [Pyrenula ochraceoflavens]